MVQFAVQKKFDKKNYSAVGSSKIARKQKIWSYISKIPVFYFWIAFAVLILVYWIFLLLKYTLFLPENRITKIDYSLNSVEIYDDPYLYKTISSKLLWENLYVISMNTHKIIKSVQEEYPFVRDVEMIFKDDNTLLIKPLFFEPELILNHNWQRFGVFGWYVFELFSGNSLGLSGVVNLHILSFSSGTSLDGIFFQNSFDKILEDIRIIKEWFPEIQGLSYLPGWNRMIVDLGGDRKVFVNNAIQIEPQILNYQYLKQYYSEFNLLKEIDLGSLESDKIIVKK